MIGMNENTGKRIEGVAYLKQRVKSVLSMRLGSSVMRPFKGSRLPKLIDSPMNQAGMFELQVAALDALEDKQNNGLEDFAVDKVTVTPSIDGKAMFSVSGTYLPDGNKITLDGVQI